MKAYTSPHTQTEGPRHRLAVSQQKAAVLSKHLQQLLRDFAPNSAVVDGANEDPIRLHVASEAGAH